MKLCVSGIIFSLLLSAAAKPGEPYILTGREKSVFSIFQADLKAYPDLYTGEDINVYYQAFKTLNNLGERKLKPGEELLFPDTAISKKIRAAEAAKAAAEARKIQTAEARSRAKETPPTATARQTSGQVSLFGSDRRSSARVMTTEEKQARAEAERKRARHRAIHYYQHTLLPNLMHDYNRNIVEEIEQGNIDALISQARKKVDDLFADSLILHAYPGRKIHILEFEEPEKVGEYFFFAIKREESGLPRFYSLEQGISIFGAGNISVLSEWRSGSVFSDLGGRDYQELSRFLQELEGGQTIRPEDD